MMFKVLDEEALRRTAYYCLVTTTDRSGGSSRLSKTAMAEFMAHEVEFLKVVADAIVTSGDEREMSSIDALNMCRKVKSRSVKQSEAEKILARLVEAKWLARTGGRGDARGGGYILSTRFIAEMAPYLKQHYEEEIDECAYPNCKKVVVRVSTSNVLLNCEVVRSHAYLFIRALFRDFTAITVRGLCTTPTACWGWPARTAGRSAPNAARSSTLAAVAPGSAVAHRAWLAGSARLKSRVPGSREKRRWRVASLIEVQKYCTSTLNCCE